MVHDDITGEHVLICSPGSVREESVCSQNYDLAMIFNVGQAQTHDDTRFTIIFAYHGCLQYTREKEREVKEEESRAITEFQVRVADFEKLMKLCVSACGWHETTQF